MTAIVTLTTDFGMTDEYAGIMKGVLHTRCPGITVIDISHGIRPQDIRQAAYLVYTAHGFFPAGAIHVIVVDPGVGTDRRIVLASANRQMFLAPDNGVLSLFLAKNLITACRAVDCRELFLNPVSPTFHGRDIMAPVAAHLAAGRPAAQVGPLIAPDTLAILPLPRVIIDEQQQTLTGALIDADHFGNLTTNIHRDDFKKLHAATRDYTTICLKVQDTVLRGIHESYAAVPPGRAVALFGSRDYLEIAVNQGNAGKDLDLPLDSPVTLRIAE